MKNSAFFIITSSSNCQYLFLTNIFGYMVHVCGICAVPAYAGNVLCVTAPLTWEMCVPCISYHIHVRRRYVLYVHLCICGRCELHPVSYSGQTTQVGRLCVCYNLHPWSVPCVLPTPPPPIKVSEDCVYVYGYVRATQSNIAKLPQRLLAVHQ